MATIKDMLDKEAYNRASIAEGLAQKIPPGKGGSPGQPYDPPKPTGPYVPPPNRNMMIAEFPRLSTGEPMTNIEQQQGLKLLEQLPKSQRRKQLKVFMDQYMKGV